MPGSPPFSIILVCHNAGSRLLPALESIGSQAGLDPELMAIDRGSSDGSLRTLEARRPRLSRLQMSGDGTVYQALNDAISAATGDWILISGAGDRLVGDAVLRETANWMKRTEAGVVAGESAFDDGLIQKLHSRVNAAAKDFTPRSATFYRRALFAENGGFDPRLSTMGGYEFNIRLWKSRVRFKPIPLRIAACAALHAKFDWRACREEIRVRHRYFSAGRCLWWDVASLLRCATARAVRKQTRRQ